MDLGTVRLKLDGGAGAGATPQRLSSTGTCSSCAPTRWSSSRAARSSTPSRRGSALVDRHMFKDQLRPSGKATGPSTADKKAKAETDVGSLLEKEMTIIMCRKRSSIAKAVVATVAKEKAKMNDKEEVEAVVGKRKLVARGPRTNKTHNSPTIGKEAVPAVADNGSGLWQRHAAQGCQEVACR